uniref:Ig-like domain-containing protein n=1 Tax=Naja naja TaxID=35670 RepID=A0A8C6Y103_NAJNA
VGGTRGVFLLHFELLRMDPPPSSSLFLLPRLEPSQGLPQFVVQGYVDDQLFVHYDSNSRKVQPRVSWIEKGTQIIRGDEELFRDSLEILRSRYNQSGGLHTIQWMYGCELRRDGSKGGFMQYGYDGRTFITFDKETLTWVAPDPQAQITKRKWDAIPGWNQQNKAYLEETCIEWLEKYLSYGNETLLRTEPPGVTVRGKTEVEDGMETHVCRLDGFYPREIDAFWTRDGEVWEEETFHGSLAPNADGTYHYWLSIRIDPKERGRYRCHVEHDGLQEPLDLALEGERLQGGTGWALWQAGRLTGFPAFKVKMCCCSKKEVAPYFII